MAIATASLLSNAPGTQHDVFLSFRGLDIRSNFKGHLYKALDQKGIHTFVDDNLVKGTEISPELITAIRKSKISIIIFSEHYAYSSWCLDELVEILKCRELFRQSVWPVFFNVSPSEVRNHTGNFGTALDQYYKGSSKIKYKEKLRNWKAALSKAGNLAGWHLSKGEDESQLVQEIVEATLSKLNRKILNVTNYPVRIEVELGALIGIAKKAVRAIGTFGVSDGWTHQKHQSICDNRTRYNTNTGAKSIVNTSSKNWMQLHSTIRIYRTKENKESIHGEKRINKEKIPLQAKLPQFNKEREQIPLHAKFIPLHAKFPQFNKERE